MHWKQSILLFGLPLVFSAPAHNADESSTIGHWEQVVDSSRIALQWKIEHILEDARNAIDAMRSDAPAVTAVIVDISKQEAVVKDQLRRRQDVNTTITSVVGTVTVSTSVVPATTSEASSTSTEIPSTTESTSTQGQSSSSVRESTSLVEISTSTTSVATTPSSTSAQSVEATTVTSTSLISVPASSTVPSGTSNTEPTSTTEGQTSTTTVVVSTVSTGLPSTSSSQEQDSSSVIIDPTTTTVISEVAPTTTTIAATTTTAPSTTAPAPTTRQSSSSAPETSAATTEQVLPTTTTNIFVDSSGSIVTSVPALATATDGEGNTVVLTSPTPGNAFTTEDQNGNVATVTYAPGGGTVSEVRFRTTTLPNGSQSTITSFATVGAPADPTSGESSSPQESDGATLQSGAATPSTSYSAEIALVLGAAFGIAALIL